MALNVALQVYRGLRANLATLASTGKQGTLAWTTDSNEFFVDSGTGTGIGTAWLPIATPSRRRYCDECSAKRKESQEKFHREKRAKQTTIERIREQISWAEKKLKTTPNRREFDPRIPLQSTLGEDI